VTIKSTQPFEDARARITGSFSFVARQGTPRNYQYSFPGQSTMNEATRQAYKELFSPESGFTWGIFENSAPQNFGRLTEIEEKLGRRFKILLRYQTIDEPLPAAQLERAWENGRLVELTLATILDTGADALRAGGGSDTATVAYEI
jgi:hypothetical protein